MKNKTIMIIMLMMMSVLFARTVRAQETEETTEPIDSIMVKLHKILWYNQYFDSFTREQFEDDSIPFPFFTGRKYVVNLKQQQLVTRKGVVTLGKKDNVLKDTRLRFDRKRNLYGSIVVDFFLPSGIKVSYIRARDGSFVHFAILNGRIVTDDSFLMWYHANKEANFEENKDDQ